MSTHPQVEAELIPAALGGWTIRIDGILNEAALRRGLSALGASGATAVVRLGEDAPYAALGYGFSSFNMHMAAANAEDAVADAAFAPVPAPEAETLHLGKPTSLDAAECGRRLETRRIWGSAMIKFFWADTGEPATNLTFSPAIFKGGKEGTPCPDCAKAI